MDGMAAHQQTLRDRHAELERKLDEEMRRPSPDSTVITALKKKKLRLKEELAA